MGLMPSLGQRTMKTLVGAVIALAVAIAAFQFAQSVFGDQTRWKGGGFGMYTEPHPNSRVAWLILTDRDGTEYRQRLWRTPSSYREQADRQPAEINEAMYGLAELAYRRAGSGDTALDAAMFATADKIPWQAGPDGHLVVEGGTPLEPVSARVEIYELRFDIHDGVIRAVAK
ncbi:MAG: hypothetical protein AAGD13_14710 [Pseudomonadota bacterium]